MILTGAIDCVCLNCAAAESRAREAEEEDDGWKPDYIGTEPLGTGTELYRAEQFTKDGYMFRFVALPRKPFIRLVRPLRKRRVSDLHVGIIGDSVSLVTTIPQIRLHTNVDAYVERGMPFWVRKVPGFDDPITGTDSIEVQPDQIVSVEKVKYETTIHLKDGGWVRLLYR